VVPPPEALAVAAGAFGVYFHVGTPAMTDNPLAARIAALDSVLEKPALIRIEPL
jgi:hypothetical protein